MPKWIDFFDSNSARLTSLVFSHKTNPHKITLLTLTLNQAQIAIRIKVAQWHRLVHPCRSPPLQNRKVLRNLTPQATTLCTASGNGTYCTFLSGQRGRLATTQHANNRQPPGRALDAHVRVLKEPQPTADILPHPRSSITAGSIAYLPREHLQRRT